MREWAIARAPSQGLAQAPSAPSAAGLWAAFGILAGGAVGSMVGAMARGASLAKFDPVAAGVGAVVGGVGGYVYGSSRAATIAGAASPPPTPSPPSAECEGVCGTMSDGTVCHCPNDPLDYACYKLPGHSDGTCTPTLPPGPYTRLATQSSLQPGGTYLLSASTAGVSNLQQALQQVVQEVRAEGLTVLGSWIGIPPAGWPSDDPNAVAGIFVALKNGTTSVATDLSPKLTIYAAGGATS